MVTPHVGEGLGTCFVEFVQAAKNEGMVSDRAPSKEPGETSDQEATPLAVWINVEDAVADL
eukprot:7250336-Lingulodinium_polyedra.AAC.1